MLSSALALKAQKPDSVFQKRNLSKTDVQLLFSYYSQNGDNSAVTGGIGTERLTLYGTNLSIANSKRNHVIKFDGGVDVISSASTDNIDYIVSSPSSLDRRAYSHLGYEHTFPKKQFNVGAKTGFSIESDYFSVPVILNAEYTTPSQLRSYSVVLESYFDDLRWGRLDTGYYRPVQLIYPVELRYKEWFDVHGRNTFNIKLGFSQVINQRLVIGIFPEVSYQRGLLATPFHRVYFNHDSVRVENLPQERFKLPIGLRLNYFAGGRTILRVNYNFYWDTWGTLASAVQLESAIKLNPKLTLSPFFRIYLQSAARYFKPYGQHHPDEMFYTSDYDLSRFISYKFGLGILYLPYAYVGKKFSFEEIAFRYSAYFQSTKLYAHTVTMLLDMKFERAIKEGIK